MCHVSVSLSVFDPGHSFGTRHYILNKKEREGHVTISFKKKVREGHVTERKNPLFKISKESRKILAEWVENLYR